MAALADHAWSLEAVVALLDCPSPLWHGEAMDPDVLRLADALDDLASFLVAHSEPTWGQWIAKDAAAVRRGDGYGVTHFLSAFGGMGSLNDVGFHPMNGNAASIPEAEELNKQLGDLISQAWGQADALRRAAQE